MSLKLHRILRINSQIVQSVLKTFITFKFKRVLTGVQSQFRAFKARKFMLYFDLEAEVGLSGLGSLPYCFERFQFR